MTRHAVYLVELTIPFETGMVEAVEHKQRKYSNLRVACCRGNGFRTTLVTVEVGSRGFLHKESFNNFYTLVKVPHKYKLALEKEMIHRAILWVLSASGAAATGYTLTDCQLSLYLVFLNFSIFSHFIYSCVCSY